MEIAFSQSGNSISFDVKNSKSSTSTATNAGAGLGLTNIRKRLDILFPSRHGLTITDSAEYYRAHLTLKI